MNTNQTYSNGDYARAYVSARGLKPLEKNISKNHIDAMAPWLLMDVAYQFYDSNINRKELKWSHELAKIKNKWAESYNGFNQRLFRSFRKYEGMEDQFIDKMDEFYDAIKKDVEIVFYSYMDCFMDWMDMDKQRIVATPLICRTLANAAEDMHEAMYSYGNEARLVGAGYTTHLHMRQVANRGTELISYIHNAEQFAIKYFESQLGKEVKESPFHEKRVQKLNDACEAIINRVYAWIDSENEKNK